jgi:ATP-binding cassette, subfamily B, bacterial
VRLRLSKFPGRAVGETADYPPLIGADDQETPYWAIGHEKAARAGIGKVILSAPRVSARILRLSWSVAPGLSAFSALLRLVSGALQVFGLLATAEVFTRLLAAGPAAARAHQAIPSVAIVIAAYAARGMLDTWAGSVQASLGPRIERRVEDDLYTGLIAVDLIAFDDPDFTHLIRRITQRAIVQFREAVNRVGDVLAGAVSVISAVVAADLLHPVLALCVLVSASPQAWASMRSAQLALDSWLRINSQHRRFGVTGSLISERANAVDVRAYTAQDVLLAEHRRIADELMNEAVRVGKRQNTVKAVGRAATAVGTVSGYAVVAALIYTGALKLALAGTAVLAMRAASAATATSMLGIAQLFESGYMIELHRTCIDDLHTRRRHGLDHDLSGDPEVIELRDVCFRYPARAEFAVHNINLTLKRGQIVALVGENGSGKSTLAKLITGLYQSDSGSVYWDHTDIATIDPHELHRRISIVTQDALRWPMTAENNIRIGQLQRKDPDGSAFDTAVRRSGADAVLESLPAGAQTMLSPQFQSGRDLSGGQWQRISIARAFFRNVPLLILDEPTAALDARAEHTVFEALRDIVDETRQLAIVVTHRLINIREADHIVVLEKGRISASGTHDQLMGTSGLYRELYLLQTRTVESMNQPSRGASW